MPFEEDALALVHRCVLYDVNRGAEYATTSIVTVASSDQRPRLSQTFPVNVMEPEVFRNPVVTEDCVYDRPPPVMLYELIVEPPAPAAPVISSVTLDLV